MIMEYDLMLMIIFGIMFLEMDGTQDSFQYKGRLAGPLSMNFWKSSKGGVSFPNQQISLQNS